jgi:hypothetical protein
VSFIIGVKYSVTNMPFMMSVVILNFIMLSVIVVLVVGTFDNYQRLLVLHYKVSFAVIKVHILKPCYSFGNSLN